MIKTRERVGSSGAAAKVFINVCTSDKVRCMLCHRCMRVVGGVQKL